jgi:hypothetical protein
VIWQSDDSAVRDEHARLLALSPCRVELAVNESVQQGGTRIIPTALTRRERDRSTDREHDTDGPTYSEADGHPRACLPCPVDTSQPRPAAALS